MSSSKYFDTVPEFFPKLTDNVEEVLAKKSKGESNDDITSFIREKGMISYEVGNKYDSGGGGLLMGCACIPASWLLFNGVLEQILLANGNIKEVYVDSITEESIYFLVIGGVFASCCLTLCSNDNKNRKRWIDNQVGTVYNTIDEMHNHLESKYPDTGFAGYKADLEDQKLKNIYFPEIYSSMRGVLHGAGVTADKAEGKELVTKSVVALVEKEGGVELSNKLLKQEGQKLARGVIASKASHGHGRVQAAREIDDVVKAEKSKSGYIRVAVESGEEEGAPMVARGGEGHRARRTRRKHEKSRPDSRVDAVMAERMTERDLELGLA